MVASEVLHEMGRRIYPRLPALLQEGLLAGYFFAKARRVYGSVFWGACEGLAASERFDADRLYALQGEGLRRMVDAATHAPYYRKLFRSIGVDPSGIREPRDLARLPMLEKETVRDNPVSFVDERLDMRTLLRVLTSGSTGAPLQVYYAPEVEALEEAFLARQWRWADFHPRERRVKLRGDVVVSGRLTPRHPWRRNPALHELRMSSFHLSPETVGAYAARVRRYRPRAIIAYPSSAATLAALVREQGLECEVPLVFTSSETLWPAQRAIIEDALGARVYNHYGLTEGVAAIQECEAGSHHVVPEYGIVEFLPVGESDLGEVREVVATGLINPAMPLLRYRTGDQVVLGPQDRCGCGREFLVVRAVVGRETEALVSASGARVHGVFLVAKALRGIRESQITQREDGTIRVLVVPTSGFSEETTEALRRELRERVGDLRIDVEQVTAIPRAENGKFRAVVSDLVQLGESRAAS